MIKYEDIVNVNEDIKTTKVKGKDYAEVPQRVKAFRKLYPMGRISTEIISLESGVCVMRAEAWTRDDNGNDLLLATGTAYEKESSSYINKTSYIENCETSAIGRALGFCGLGIDTSIASAEEVGNAIENQKKSKKISASEVRKIKLTLEDTNSNIDAFLKVFNVEKIEDLTEGDLWHDDETGVWDMLNRKVKDMQKKEESING